MATVEELEAKRAQRQEQRARDEADQYAKDLEAMLSLEDEHGPLAAVKMHGFKKGFPTRAFARTPQGNEYKRYVDQIGKAVDRKNTGDQRKAQELLARSCWVYPAEKEEQEAMLAAFPGLLTSLAIAASALAEGKAEDEGKG